MNKETSVYQPRLLKANQPGNPRKRIRKSYNKVQASPNQLQKPESDDTVVDFPSIGINSCNLLKSIAKQRSRNIYDIQKLGFTSSEPTESVSAKFNNPFDQELTDSNNIPEYVIPKSYYLRKPILKSSHISKFSEFTLFYIFFSMASELHQALAAEDLYRRNWKFDSIEQTWVKEQSGQWTKFDQNRWEIVPCRNSGWNFVLPDAVRIRKGKNS